MFKVYNVSRCPWCCSAQVAVAQTCHGRSLQGRVNGCLRAADRTAG